MKYVESKIENKVEKQVELQTKIQATYIDLLNTREDLIKEISTLNRNSTKRLPGRFTSVCSNRSRGVRNCKFLCLNK